MHRTVLIATYEFPPAGGGGVQRIAKFCRYLPEFGWAPVIVTSAPAKGRPVDASLLREVGDSAVVRLPSWRVSAYTGGAVKVLRRVRGVVRPRGERAAGAARPVAVRTRARGLGPQLARRISMDDASLWAIVAAVLAAKLGRTHGVAAVVATGPPFSVALCGARLAKRLDVPLVVDMRDPWRDNWYAWYPNERSRRRRMAVERRVLRTARVVVATTETIAAEARDMGACDVRVISNGYDAADIVPWKPRIDDSLRLSFMGTMYDRGLANPTGLLEALARLREGHPDLDIRLDVIGTAANSIRERVARLGLTESVTFAGYLPHQEAVRRLASADVAVATIRGTGRGAQAAVAAKVYEYFGVGIPVLALVPPDGETARVVNEGHAGWVLPCEDVEQVAAKLKSLVEEKRQGPSWSGATREFASQFDRRLLTGELAAVLDEITSA